MSEPRDPVQHPEPPEDLITAPNKRVTALMDEPDEVAAAIDELAEAGFYPREEIFVLCGVEGAERFDIAGRHHGIRGRLHRLSERVDGIGEAATRGSDHMAAGGCTISVPSSGEQKAAVADILSRHGGHEIIYHNKMTWEELTL